MAADEILPIGLWLDVIEPFVGFGTSRLLEVAYPELAIARARYCRPNYENILTGETEAALLELFVAYGWYAQGNEVVDKRIVSTIVIKNNKIVSSHLTAPPSTTTTTTTRSMSAGDSTSRKRKNQVLGYTKRKRRVPTIVPKSPATSDVCVCQTAITDFDSRPRRWVRMYLRLMSDLGAVNSGGWLLKRMDTTGKDNQPSTWSPQDVDIFVAATGSETSPSVNKEEWWSQSVQSIVDKWDALFVDEMHLRPSDMVLADEQTPMDSEYDWVWHRTQGRSKIIRIRQYKPQYYPLGRFSCRLTNYDFHANAYPIQLIIMSPASVTTRCASPTLLDTVQSERYHQETRLLCHHLVSHFDLDVCKNVFGVDKLGTPFFRVHNLTDILSTQKISFEFPLLDGQRSRVDLRKLMLRYVRYQRRGFRLVPTNFAALVDTWIDPLDVYNPGAALSPVVRCLHSRTPSSTDHNTRSGPFAPIFRVPIVPADFKEAVRARNILHEQTVACIERQKVLALREEQKLAADNSIEDRYEEWKNDKVERRWEPRRTSVRIFSRNLPPRPTPPTADHPHVKFPQQIGFDETSATLGLCASCMHFEFCPSDGCVFAFLEIDHAHFRSLTIAYLDEATRITLAV